jgi:hypothetical protein
MTPLEIAQDFFARGWNPVPVKHREKKPMAKEWQRLRLSEAQLANHFGSEPMNVGIQLGRNSGGLVDVDHDAPESLSVASRLMPGTACIFGRASNPASHRLYVSTLWEQIDKAAVRFEDPTPKQELPAAVKSVLLELRIGGGEQGAQTVGPGSVHVSGELIEFESGCDGAPERVGGDLLMTCAKETAAAALAARYWPPEGSRHETRLAVAGLLVRAGIEQARALQIIEAIAAAAGDLMIDDARSDLNSTYKRSAEGASITGVKLAREVFGDKVAERIAKWLGTPFDSASSTTDSDFEASVDRLAKLSPLDYDRVRISEAKRLGVRVAVLDSQVEKRRAKDGGDGRGRPLTLPAPEPWTELVDGAELLNAIAEAVADHVRLTDADAAAITLWCVHAHAFGAALISPRLVITSPEKRCGKTTLLRVIQNLTPKPLQAANITAAALFRTVEAARPTLLIDEADSFLADNEELRGIINSGHAADGQVVRLVGDDHEPRAFSTFCPTAIAAIGALPGTIQDRSITIRLRRRKKSEPVARMRGDRCGRLQDLSRKAARWVADNLTALRELDPALPEALHDRDADNWRSLVSIADLAAYGWPEKARFAAGQLSKADFEDADATSTMLLSDIRDLFREKKTDRLFTSEIIFALSGLAERPWQFFERGRSLSPAALARMLRPFGIVPGTVRSGGQTAKGYMLESFEDAFSRYLPPEDVTPSQA